MESICESLYGDNEDTSFAGYLEQPNVRDEDSASRERFVREVGIGHIW